MTMKPFVLFLSLGIFIGGHDAIITVYDEILLSLDYDYDEEVAYLGMGIQAASILVLIVVGVFMDITKTFLCVATHKTSCILYLLLIVKSVVLRARLFPSETLYRYYFVTGIHLLLINIHLRKLNLRTFQSYGMTVGKRKNLSCNTRMHNEQRKGSFLSDTRGLVIVSGCLQAQMRYITLFLYDCFYSKRCHGMHTLVLETRRCLPPKW